MKIITIHGIRKKRDWDTDFKGLSIWQNSGVEVLNFQYGYFPLYKFLNPYSRKKIYKRFQEFYSAHINPKDNPPSVVGHSFGTKIFFYAIKQYSVIKFDKVILCGSILNSKTRFDKYFDNKQIKYLINDYGSFDGVVKYSRLVMRDCGRSGERGFKNIAETHNQIFKQRQNYLDHSDYFLNIHMAENWAKFLMPEKLYKYDHRVLRGEIIDRIYTNIGISNDKLEYSSVHYCARIDEKGNYFAHYTKNGINKTGNCISEYPVITTADSLNSIEEMLFEAKDRNNKTLIVTPQVDENQNKRFLIHFDEPVNNNQDFSIVYRFRWKETINQKNGDTDHFEIYNARNITTRLNFKNRLKSPRYFILNKGKIISQQKATLQNEIDGTYTYTLEYANDENSDGLIFYFDGIDIQTIKRFLKPMKTKELNTKTLVQISKCHPNDIREVYSIELKVEHSNAASEMVLKQRLSMFNDGFLVAKIDNKIVGYIESVLWNFGDFDEFEQIKNFPLHYNSHGSELYIIFVAVHEDFRKNGIARELIGNLENTAKKFGAGKVRLVAKDDLVNLYSKLGFQTVRELPNFLRDRPYKSVLMEKYLG